MKKTTPKKAPTKTAKATIKKPAPKKVAAKKITKKTPTKTTKAIKPTKKTSPKASAKSSITPETLDEQCAKNPIIKKIVDATNEIIDPEIGIGIVDLGLIYGVTLNKKQAIITMTLTSMGCPVGPMIVEQIETLIPQIVPEINHADTQIVWEPPWSPDRMKPDVRDMIFNF